MVRTSRWLALAGILALTGLFAQNAQPAYGTPGTGASATVLAQGAASVKVKMRGGQPYEVAVQQVTLAPGGHTGWHTHPGPAIVVVKAGTLTIYDGADRTCAPHRFAAGQVYIDHGYGHVHIGRNEGAVPLQLYVTYLDVPPGDPLRIDRERPGNCPF